MQIPNSQKILINSVERFQDSEREIIIVTTVRTADLGFMACNRVCLLGDT